MTHESATVGPRAVLESDESERELLLLDSEWIDAEFAAIMIASGFGDRIIVATDPRPLDGLALEVPETAQAGPSWDRGRFSSRVRSPPSP